jgi:hypothetical protein
MNYPSNQVLTGYSGNTVLYGPAIGNSVDALGVLSGKAVIVVNDDGSDIGKNITANSGEDEARPSNSTYLIWRRTA